MPLPYENSTSGDKALADIQKTLQAFGCKQFGTMFDEEAGEVRVMFKWRHHEIILPASYHGYAAALLKKKPFQSEGVNRCTRVQYERKAMDQAKIAVYSILRDWVKAQVTLVETGILRFEGAFLGQIMLPNGSSVMDHLQQSDVLRLEQLP